MRRLFIAVALDDETCAALGELVESLRKDPRLRKAGRTTWVKPDRIHLTLYFEGEADETMLGQMLAAVDHPIPVAPFRLTLADLGMFPEHGSPRVLWVGIGEGRRDLAAVHDEIARRVAGDRPRRSPSEVFRPHLTLARFRDRVKRSDLDGLEAIRVDLRSSTIDRVTLYESRLSPKGPSYTVLAQAPLKGTE